MTETRPLQSAQPSTGASTHAPDRRLLQQDTLARFRQALNEPGSGFPISSNPPATDRSNQNTSATDAERRDPDANPQTNAKRGDPSALRYSEYRSLDALTRVERQGFSAATIPQAERRDANTQTTADAEHRQLDATALGSAERRDRNTSTAADLERRDPNSSAPIMPATVASLHYSLPVTQATPELATGPNTLEAARLIEQATSVLMERASRSDACRFIVSLDHAIVGGASAEFVRDGAFLHVRLLARNDAGYRSMWTNRAELEQRLATSTGLVTRVEIIEGYGDGRSA